MSPPAPYPHDQDRLLREIDASIKIKDIRRIYRLRDEVEVKWWESALVLLLFVSSLGLLALILIFFRSEPGEIQAMVQRTIFLFLIPFILSIVLTLEVVLVKINALRKLNALSVDLIENMRLKIENLSGASGAASSKSEGETEPSSD